MEKTGASFVAAVLGLALGGCGDIPLKESDVEWTLPAQTAQITPAETDRTEVRRLLGEPVAASEYWQFDLYQLSDKNAELIWIWVPVGVSSQAVNAYVLVTYDEHGVVADYSHDIARESSTYRSDRGEQAFVRAGHFRLVTGKREAFLAVDPERRNLYLQQRNPPDHCLVLIGCAEKLCDAKVVIEGESVIDLPGAATSDWSALAPIEIAPGRRRIEAMPSSTEARFSASAELECSGGDHRYVALQLEHDPTATGYKFWRKYVARLDVSAVMPDAWREQPLVIWSGGQWLVPQEPGR